MKLIKTLRKRKIKLNKQVCYKIIIHRKDLTQQVQDK